MLFIMLAYLTQAYALKVRVLNRILYAGIKYGAKFANSCNNIISGAIEHSNRGGSSHFGKARWGRGWEGGGSKSEHPFTKLWMSTFYIELNYMYIAKGIKG